MWACEFVRVVDYGVCCVGVGWCGGVGGVVVVYYEFVYFVGGLC